MAPRQQRREPGHDASRHIRGHGEVRDRAVAPYPTSTIYSGNRLGRLEADNHSTRNIFVVLLRVATARAVPDQTNNSFIVPGNVEPLLDL